jgi:hypothetical protein
MTDTAMETTTELERIARTGTTWFASALLAAAVPLALLTSSGWRPSDLPALDALAWWVGAFVSVAALALLAWAGCPVFAFTPEIALRQKQFSIRVGVVLFLAGSVVSTFAVLTTPAG